MMAEREEIIESQATDPRDAEIERLKAELESTLACNRGLVRLNEAVHDRALAAEARIATLTAERDALREAVTQARGSLGYIYAQAGLGHPGFNTVAKMNAENAIAKIDRALTTTPSKTETRLCAAPKK
jgi:hypothetical protein